MKKVSIARFVCLVIGLGFGLISFDRASAQGFSGIYNGIGYAGEWMLPSGLVHLRARAYNPTEGRFLQRDLFAGFVDDPQPQNRYYYTNNPANWIDPYGYTPTYPEFDDLLPRGKGYLPKGSVLGRGGNATVYGLPNGGGLGVVRKGSPVSLSELGQYADDLKRLGDLGVPVVQRTVGTYYGRPAWIFPPESRGILHSFDDNFIDPQALRRVVGVNRLQQTQASLARAANIFRQHSIRYDDLQGVIAANGEFLFDDPSYGITFNCKRLPTGTMNLLNDLQNQVDDALRIRDNQGGFVRPRMLGKMTGGALLGLGVAGTAADLGDAYGRYGYGPEMAHRAMVHAGGYAGGLAGGLAGAAIGGILGPGGAIIGGIIGGAMTGSFTVDIGLPR